MKRPLAYITAAWLSGDSENAEQAARYCRAVYEAGFSPICPPLYLPLFLNDAVPEEHKSGIDMGRDLLRRSHVLALAWPALTMNTNDLNLKNFALSSICRVGCNIPKLKMALPTC